MSLNLNESVESTLFVSKGVDLSCGEGVPDKSSTRSRSTSVDVKAELNRDSSCTKESVHERLKMDDSLNNSGVINGKKPLICYETMNGFKHVTNCEALVNGEPLSVCDDANNMSEALTEKHSDKDNVCSIAPDHEKLNADKIESEKNAAECIEPLKADSQGHSVEELIDKLAKTPISFNEDSDHLSLLSSEDVIDGINYVIYESERQMPDIMRLITKDLSEPYSIYTYRYFIHNWPKLCFLAMDNHNCVGAIVCKLDVHKKMVRRGYIAMLAVDSGYRRRRLGSTLVTKAIHAMIRDDCDEVVLETEITNQAALHLYENLGFVRDKRLFRYYLNGVDALRLKLWLR